MDEATGARLRDAREQRGITTGEVAAAIGIPVDAVTDIEQGDAVSHYGPGLAAAWTWAVGRHLDVAVDQDLATWQPPTADAPPPGVEEAGPRDHALPSHEPAEEPDHPGAGAEPGREPKVTPGWLADFDVDPLWDFDPAADEGLGAPEATPPTAEHPGDAGPPETDDEDMRPTSLPGAGSDPLGEGAQTPSGAEDHPGPPTLRPTDDLDDDLWSPEPEQHWSHQTDPQEDSVQVDEPGEDTAAADAGTAAPRPQEPPDRGGSDPWATTQLQAMGPFSGAPAAARPPEDSAAHAGTPPDEPDEPEEELVPEEPEEGPAPSEEAASDVDRDAAPEHTEDGHLDTGELPTAEDDTRVLAYTEGDEAPRLEPPSRLRGALVVIAGLLVLVVAGIGVGAVFAQLLDTPDDDDAAAVEDAAGSEQDDADGGSTDDSEPADEGSDTDDGDGDGDGDEPDDSAISDLAGDPAAAADPRETDVQVLDGGVGTERYADAVGVLEDLGYLIIASGPATRDYAETTVFVTEGYDDEAAGLAVADDRFTNVVANDVGLSEDVELHVVVGDDWPDPTGE